MIHRRNHRKFSKTQSLESWCLGIAERVGRFSFFVMNAFAIALALYQANSPSSFLGIAIYCVTMLWIVCYAERQVRPGRIAMIWVTFFVPFYYAYVLPMMFVPSSSWVLALFPVETKIGFLQVLFADIWVVGTLVPAWWMLCRLSRREPPDFSFSKLKVSNLAVALQILVIISILGVAYIGYHRLRPIAAIAETYYTAGSYRALVTVNLPEGFGKYVLAIRLVDVANLIAGVTVANLRLKRGLLVCLLLGVYGGWLNLVLAGRLGILCSFGAPFLGYILSRGWSLRLTSVLGLTLPLVPLALIYTGLVRTTGGVSLGFLERFLTVDYARLYCLAAVFEGMIPWKLRYFLSDMVSWLYSLPGIGRFLPEFDRVPSHYIYSQVVTGFESAYIIPGYLAGLYLGLGPVLGYFFAVGALLLAFAFCARGFRSGNTYVFVVSLGIMFYWLRYACWHSMSLGLLFSNLLIPLGIFAAPLLLLRMKR